MKTDFFDLRGETAMVTGGSKGLGESFARALAQAGADLFLVARRQPDLQRAASEIIAEYGVSCHYYPMDIGSEAQINAAVAECVRHYGKVDILVNNAAEMRHNLAPEETSADEFNAVIHPNVTGTFLVAKAAAREMIKRHKGNIVNIASMSGLIVNKGVHGGSYEVSKAAVIMLTKTLATEWAKYGIQVNCICPGYFGTQPNLDYFTRDPSFYDSVIDMIPMKRIGQPKELWGALLLLCSPAASYMQGSAITVDGGYTLW
jgi:NAD(P)-dependent dehydrogenase (short-subunit alcohol dehydrogenase family)